VRLQQVVKPGPAAALFTGHMQLAPQTVDKLQNTAALVSTIDSITNLPPAIHDGNHYGFLVHVHADIVDVATLAVASLRERSFASISIFPSRERATFEMVRLYLPAVLPLGRFNARPALS